MAAAVDQQPPGYPDSPLDEEVAYPCKGCGNILEEGKAFELAGLRWHIECFSCNTCGTLLDSDANLLILGDGSLICNACTYSCSACGQKIEDLAILTGDQAYCAGCFRCRNCKRKIENLRYARTSQGMFCMDCHEGLMARRRKKKSTAQRKASAASGNSSVHLDKNLPSLPPGVGPSRPDEGPHQLSADPPPMELMGSLPPSRGTTSRGNTRDRSPAPSTNSDKDNLKLPSSSYRANRNSSIRGAPSESLGQDGDDFYIPMALDLNPTGSSPHPMASASTEAPREELPGDYFNVKPKSAARSKQSRPEPGPRSDSHGAPKSGSSGPQSPHIAYQEKRAELESDTQRRQQLRAGSTDTSPHPVRTDSAKAGAEGFKLQEAPKRKKSISTPSWDAPVFDGAVDTKAKSAPVTAVHGPLREQSANIGPDSTRTSELPTPTAPSPRLESKSATFPPTAPANKTQREGAQGSLPPSLEIATLPKRGDSLQRSAASSQTMPPRKEVPTPPAAPASRTSLESPSTTGVNGGRVISRPMESPVSKSSMLDFPSAVSGGATTSSTNESFISPRAPPAPPVAGSTPADKKHAANGAAHPPSSPSLPPPREGGELSLDQDMARILGHDETDRSFLKRVSNSVRHARSQSDRGSRNSRDNKWPNKAGPPPANGALTTAPSDAGTISPTVQPSSPESVRGEAARLREELARERARAAEREARLAELEAAAQGQASLQRLDGELRRKRSTMVVLDTQKEMVVRELEILTAHLAREKAGGQPLDVARLQEAVVRDFAQDLRRLQDSFRPALEDLAERRLQLTDECARLEAQRERAAREFEALSAKNAQLAELNNALAQGVGPRGGDGGAGSGRNTPSGLGIYAPPPPHLQNTNNNHHKDPRPGLDQGFRSAGIDPHFLGSLAPNALPASLMVGPPRPPGSTAGDSHDGATGADGLGTAAVVSAPTRVVNLRKEQPTKKTFGWMKGGGHMAKGMTKGLKGAFSSVNNSESKAARGAAAQAAAADAQREGSLGAGGSGGLIETIPYSGIAEGSAGAPRTGSQPGGPARAQQLKGKMQPTGKGMNGSAKSLTAPPPPDAATTLFGSDLQERADFERVQIPNVVTRCIQEVELRGMDTEGIYRKSGGTSQCNAIRDAFEAANDYEGLSDPELDIHAVTSILKQYFRWLPEPLITFAVYDDLLLCSPNPPPTVTGPPGTATAASLVSTLVHTSTNVSSASSNGDGNGSGSAATTPPATGPPVVSNPMPDEERVRRVRRCLGALPPRHRDCLAFLMFHLARVAARERATLMPPQNCAVVFAPTIMRPESLEREVTDTTAKTEIIRFLVEHCDAIFLDEAGEVGGAGTGGMI